MTSGGGGGEGDLAQRLGVDPVRTGLREGYLEIQIYHYLTVTARTNKIHLSTFNVSIDSKAPEPLLQQLIYNSLEKKKLYSIIS